MEAVPRMRLRNRTSDMPPYEAARIQLVEIVRTAASNLEEVGQIRSRKGTSINKMKQPNALGKGLVVALPWKPRNTEITYTDKAPKIMNQMLMVMRVLMPVAQQRMMQRMPSLLCDQR